jgi:hypothetical protein
LLGMQQKRQCEEGEECVADHGTSVENVEVG